MLCNYAVKKVAFYLEMMAYQLLYNLYFPWSKFFWILFVILILTQFEKKKNGWEQIQDTLELSEGRGEQKKCTVD